MGMPRHFDWRQSRSEASMKKMSLISILVVFFIWALLPNAVMAESKAETYLGSPEMCLDIPRIKETLILDNQTIIFRMLGGDLYINRLPIKCHGLKIANGFGYSTSIAKVCMQDLITTISPGSAPGSTCSLGEFWPFLYDGESKEAIKRLKDGLLEELVATGIFTETFPDEE